MKINVSENTIKTNEILRIYEPVLIRNGKCVLFLKAMKTLVKQQERDIKKKQQRERERESERTMKM